MRLDDATTVSLHESPRMSDTDRRLIAVIPPGGNYSDVPDDLATPRILRFKKTGGRTTTYGRLHPDRPAYTINTYFRRPNVGCHFHYAQERLITAREAMRFQALPDAMELSYTRADQRNALIGNAVPSLLARAIAMTVAEALSRRRRRVPLVDAA
jgi:DNA (cytosine-5)-methyltransferase 1